MHGRQALFLELLPFFSATEHPLALGPLHAGIPPPRPWQCLWPGPGPVPTPRAPTWRLVRDSHGACGARRAEQREVRYSMPQLGAGRTTPSGVLERASLSDGGEDAEAVALTAAEEATAPEERTGAGSEAATGQAAPRAEEKPAPAAPAATGTDEREEMALDALILQTLFGEPAEAGAGGEDDIEEVD